MYSSNEAISISCKLCPTIVVIAYNRPESLKRLLRSLTTTHLPDNNVKVRLVISIDGGGDAKTIEVARGFLWAYGDKMVIERDQNLGLKEHVLQCGDMSQDYGSVILLEDDLVVSPAFYDFSCQTLGHYTADRRIAGISLYSQRLNETAGCFFEPINNGYSVFLSRMPSSCGQAFTSNQWRFFREWLKNRMTLSDSPEIPKNIRGWPKSSWKKYFCDYMVCSKKWFVYPYISYTTNFGDIGCHYARKSTIMQVELITNSSSFVFPTVKDAIKYDLYWELEMEGFVSGRKSKVLWDLYGTKTCLDSDYIVSCRDLVGYRKIQGFALDLRPVQLNYFMENEGTDFWLQERIQKDSNLKSSEKVNDNCEKFLRKLGFSRCDLMPARDIFLLFLSRLLVWIKEKLGMVI
jgi:glycosyltransferase involved in cell wall biosynthesis